MIFNTLRVQRKRSNGKASLSIACFSCRPCLNKIAWTLTQQGLQIAQSHISTYGERAVDVFYVKDVFGLKVEQEGKIAAVRKALLAALDELDEQAAA